MRKKYNPDKLTERKEPVKTSESALKVSVNIRVDGSTVAAIKTEAMRIGLSYQDLISSILHRFVTGDLVDKGSRKNIS